MATALDINKILEGQGGLILTSEEANYLRGYVRAVQEHSERYVAEEQAERLRAEAQAIYRRAELEEMLRARAMSPERLADARPGAVIELKNEPTILDKLRNFGQRS